ncbi:MAG: hemagglutinin repeat-containing protein [Brachymonas sp.]
MNGHASFNRCYTVVWSDTHQAYVVTHEATRRKGKRSGVIARPVAQTLLAVFAAFGAGGGAIAGVVPSTVVPTGGNTVAYVSANGVPVVDINTANAAGLSHNQFTRYDVDPKGLVLNNGNTSQMARQSQLAGQVMANTNLSNEARIILNEVVSANRSTLAGFTEVVGGKADVIIANPYGITCSGCGYINTDRVTMTTGTPNFSANGALAGFTVNGGDILINGNGLNASAQQVLDLVARAIKIDGQVNATQELGLTAGANQWDYASRSVTGSTTASGSAPAYAIDSSALGGMYAGRIRILATEAGVGVRMLGDAAATADDFTLNAAGQVVVGSKVSAKRDLAANSSSNAANALTLNNASLTAQRDISVTAAQGGAQITGGALVAGQNLGLNAKTLSDSSSTASDADNNKRYAGGTASLTVAQTANLDGTAWGAGSALHATTGSLTVGSAGAQMYSNGAMGLTATTGDLALNTAAVSAKNDVNLTANAGAIQTTTGANQGVQSTAGNIALNATAGVSNAGVIDAKAGNVTVRANGTVSNSGSLHAKGNLDVADRSNAASNNFSNTGTVLAEGTANIKATTFSNTSNLQGSQATTIAANTLTNSGLLVASNSSTGAGSITANTLINQGTLQSAQNLTVTANTQFQNSGTVLAQGQQTLNAAAGIQNSGTLQANGNQNLQLSSSTLNNSSSGKVLAQGTQQIAAGSLTNAGVVQAASTQTLGITGAASNSGTVLGQASQTANLGSLNNTGTWQANQGGNISATGDISNSGALTVSTVAGKHGSVSGKNINNQVGGTIQSAGNLNLTATGTQLNNAGKVIAAGDLGISTTGSNAAIINKINAYLQAGGSLTVNPSNGASLDNQAGASVLANALGLTLTSLTNAGVLQGGSGNSTITVANTLNNSGTLTLANLVAGTGNISADTLNNTGTLQSKGSGNLNIGTAFSNSGTTVVAGNLTVRGNDSAYSVNNSGRLESLSTLDIKGQNAGQGVTVTVGNAGVLKGQTLLLNSQSLTVEGNANQGGMVNTSGVMALNVGQLKLDGSKSRIVAGTGNSSIDVDSAFSNSGAVFAAGNLSFTANAITNTTTGAIAAGGDLTAHADNGAFDNYGALYAGNKLEAKTSSYFTNRGSVSGEIGTLDAGIGGIVISAYSFTNQSSINSLGDIAISAATFHNDVAGGDTRYWAQVSDTGDKYDKTDEWYDFPDDYAREYWYRERREEQKFSGATPTYKPRIIATNALTINQFNTGTNTGAILSAKTINLNGAGGSSTFKNIDLSLGFKKFRHDWNYYTHWIAKGPAKYDDHVLKDSPERVVDQGNVLTISSGIYATTLNATGFGLSNIASPWAAGVDAKTENGATSANVGAGLGGTSGVDADSAIAGGSAATSITLPGVNINLPSNPNGYFVTNQNPNAQYLVETNPMYAVGSNFVGSNYLAERYGYSPDEIGKRLGDSNYEAYLIREQLIKQTGGNILKGQADEAAQMQALMDNAANQGKKLGLQWGQALSVEQISKLNGDIVWMVETAVAGQKVLAPVVYLSAATKKSIQTGAVISATDANLNLTSLTNSGGTISGSSSLNIVSQGDVRNTGGTITGGNVSVKSTEGSIINETAALTTGDDKYRDTVIGKTGTISSTGDLDLDAKKNIAVTGAQISAGGNASLKAGDAITFDTIEDKKARTTSSSQSDGWNSTVTTTTVATTNQIKSGLTVGGNLQMQAKNDVTLAGTDVKVGGDADISSTDGNINVLARANSSKTTTNTIQTGAGVGGGVVGKITTDKVEEHDRNVGSTIQIGGDAKMKAKSDITFEGATVNVGGDGDLDAGGNLNILDGKDRDYSHTTTTTTTFLKVEKGNDSGKASGKTETKAGAQAKGLSASAGASAGASGEAENKSSGGLVLAQKTVETQTDEDVRSVGSKINFGGNLKAKAGKDVNLRGSELAAAGDVEVDATNVNVLAGQNKKTSSRTNSTTKVGFMGDSTNKASGSASAGAGAKAGITGANASASAEASGEASSENRLALAKVSKTTEDSLDITHNASAIKSGGNMKIKAKEGLNTVGSSIESGGDMDLQARDMSFQDAQDVHEVKRSSDETSAGLYLDASGKASANAGAKAKAGGLSMDAKATAGASAKVEGSVSAGLYGTNTRSGSTEGSTKAQVSSIKAGGSIKRTAENSIKDVGTQIEAGGDFEQSAKKITSLAARDTTYATSNSETNTAKIGAYAEGSAGVSAEANGSAGGMGKAAGKSVQVAGGIKASFEQEKEGSSSNTSTAVVSSIKAGGKIKSKSSGATEMEGTQLKSGGDTELEADSLNYRAAANTSSKTNTSRKIGAELKVDIVNKGGSVEGSYGNESSRSSSSDAVVGGIDTGGALKIKTKGDARLEGTQIVSGGDTELDVGGNLRVDAARNTQTSDSKGLDVTASVSASKSGKSKSGALSAEGSYNESHEEASQAVVSNMLSGGKLKIKTGGDASFEGANLGAKGDTELDAKGKIDFAAARDTAKSSSLDVAANLGGSMAKEGASGSGAKRAGPSSDASGSFGVGVGKSSSESSTATGGSITSGGKLKITSGSDARFEGTDISATGDASVAAKGNLTFDAARSTHKENSVDVSAGASGRKASGLASRSTEEQGTAFGRDGRGTQNGTRTEAAGNLGVGVGKKESSTAVAGAIRSGGNLSLSSGGNTTLEGTQVAAAGKAAINAGGKVEFKAAESTSSNLGVDVGVGGSMLRTTGAANAALPGSNPGLGTVAKKGIQAIRKTQPTPAPAPGATPAPRSVKEVSGHIGVDVGSSHTSQAGSIAAGQGIQINAGQDMTLVGTQLNSGAGSTALTAGGNIDLQAAKSSSKSTGVHLEVGKVADGAPDTKAKSQGGRTNSSSSSQGVNIQGQGDLLINAGGAVSMEGTKADMGGKAKINAIGGITEKAAPKDTQTSKGLGGEKPKALPKAQQTPVPKPDPKAKDTEIQAKGGVKENTGVAAQAEVLAKLKQAAEDLKKSQAAGDIQKAQAAGSQIPSMNRP